MSISMSPSMTMTAAAMMSSASHRAASTATTSTTTAAAAAASSGVVRSLALSVHFKHPDFGMKKYEILSRATAFLLSVDPFYDPAARQTSNDGNDQQADTKASSAIFSHLEDGENRRSDRTFRQNYALDPAGGPPGRDATELGWLEFCPTRHRPIAHCLASSHVLAPWRWKQYYPQEWVSHVEPRHCAYSVEVICPTRPDRPLAKFALSPYPIHHPDGLDLAIIHLKGEESALDHMKKLGVEMSFHLRDPDKLHFRGEDVTFDGFRIESADAAEASDVELTSLDTEEDTRVFEPYQAEGKLLFGSPDRYLAETANPLPQGLCGGPVVDTDNRIAGVVEGIVPVGHEDKAVAGAAAFIPSAKVREFLDTAERGMLEKVLPKELFDKVTRLKEGKELLPDDGVVNMNDPGKERGGPSDDRQQQNAIAEQALNDLVKGMEKHHSPQEINAIMDTIRGEREEVVDILNREGGDLDEVIAKVRKRTREKQMRALRESAAADEAGEEEEEQPTATPVDKDER